MTLEEKPELLQDSIACNKLWKKSLLVDHGLAFKEGKYYEDLALTMKGAVLAKKNSGGKRRSLSLARPG
ncbi:hypothetical protein FK545_02160 [Planococcus glaciei]|nr:hypothetical protein [Planococcus glaciei]QDY44749.1 hypothetical protein FK545_02160 [Planococcus glaciei]